jgi:secondary thiamine-phosphate synthase enzyme
MAVYQATLKIQTSGKGTREITRDLAAVLEKSGMDCGVVSVFCRHTSCSLVIMENADPSARRDLEMFFEKLVPEDDPDFVHTMEGPDDMPSHIKMALTRTSEAIPFSGGRMALGTWQGVYLWEHRLAGHTRTVLVTVQGE